MNLDAMKRAAAEYAADFVRPGMRLGLGSGSTARHFVEVIGQRVRNGLSLKAAPTSEETRALAKAHAIPLTSLEETPELDLAVDGADEIDPRLRLIKGGGGAHLREKIVASAARHMLVIADEGKCVETLGRFPLPIEVVPFGLAATRAAIARVFAACGLAGELTLRPGPNGAPFVTDGGHFIVDASLGRIARPEALARALEEVPGVVEHGLFIGVADAAVIAGPGGVRMIGYLTLTD